MEASERLTPPVGNKLDYVDALRGWAILGVLAVHSLLTVSTTQHLPPVFSTLISNGAWGVRLFFIASAFTLLLSAQNRYRQERRPTLNFLLRRWFRIAPLYYAGMLAYALWAYRTTQTVYPLRHVAKEVLFLHGFSVNGMINSIVPGGWSIAVEMVFYCLLPLLLPYLTSLTRALWVLLASILFQAACSWVLRQHPLSANAADWNLYLAWYLPKQLPVFCLGFVFYFLTRQQLPVKAGVVLAFGLLLIAAFGAKASLAQAPAAFELVPGDLGMGLGLLLFALALSMRQFSLFVNRFTRSVGEISFSLYLVHFGVLYLLRWFGLVDLVAPTTTVRALLNYGLRYVIVFISSYVLAYLLYHAIEKTGQKLGKKVIAQLG